MAAVAPPVAPVQALVATPQPQAISLPVTISLVPVASSVPAQSAVAAPGPALAPKVPAAPVQVVSHPGPIRNLIGNVGETLALAKKVRVVTYYDPTPPPLPAPVAPQAITALATPQSFVHRKCLQWFQP